MAGLRDHASDIIEPLCRARAVAVAGGRALPLVGRTFFGAHLAMPRSEDPLLSGWHAVNCLREWRGDTHWALVVADGPHPCRGVASSTTPGCGYEPDWLPRSRGTSDTDLEAGWKSLTERGLADEPGGHCPMASQLRQQHRGRDRPR